jgi:hypothetical protein
MKEAEMFHRFNQPHAQLELGVPSNFALLAKLSINNFL